MRFTPITHREWFLSLVIAGAFAAVRPSLARADGTLEVRTPEGASWAASIAGLQARAYPAGTRFLVVVVDSESRRTIPCGSYTLALDARGIAALRVGTCNPINSATEIVLADRNALFSPGNNGISAQPIAVRAILVRDGTATTASAPTVAGVEFHCTASVRPYLANAVDGRFVYLTPDQYSLEPLDTRAHAAVDPNGWTVSSTESTGRTDVAFRIVDRRDGREVTRNHVSMQCNMGDANAHLAGNLPGRTIVPLHLPVGAVGRGNTDGAAMNRLSCTSTEAPTMVWRYIAPADGNYEFILQGGYDTALEVRSAASDARSLGCSDDDRIATHSRVVMRLTRGAQYDLWVSGQGGSAGSYEVAVIPIPDDVELRSGR